MYLPEPILALFALLIPVGALVGILYGRWVGLNTKPQPVSEPVPAPRDTKRDWGGIDNLFNGSAEQDDWTEPK